jgi:hypothetical protein
MSSSRTLLKASRLVHLYFGVFITPALIFFAFTGALQTFNLHESHPNSAYKPPAWIVTLGQIHKKQTPVVPQRRPRPAEQKPPLADQKPPQAAASTPARVHHPLPMKIFFLVASIGLFISSVTGLYMSWKYTHNRITIALTLLAGIIVPVILAFV